MTEEAQRIAISELCGWEEIIFRGVFDPTERDWVGHHESLCPSGKTGRWQGPLPDYLNDLNAINESELCLFNKRPGYYDRSFVTELCGIMGLDQDTGMHDKRTIFHLLNATAAQRCEAFLKTLGRWVDGK